LQACPAKCNFCELGWVEYLKSALNRWGSNTIANITLGWKGLPGTSTLVSGAPFVSFNGHKSQSGSYLLNNATGLLGSVHKFCAELLRCQNQNWMSQHSNSLIVWKSAN